MTEQQKHNFAIWRARLSEQEWERTDTRQSCENYIRDDIYKMLFKGDKDYDRVNAWLKENDYNIYWDEIQKAKKSNETLFPETRPILEPIEKVLERYVAKIREGNLSKEEGEEIADFFDEFVDIDY
jgi:translation initiation factor 2 beta subunit (eIF-2beta)/eIF-5